MIGDPNAVPTCSVADLDTGNCSGASQVGDLGLITSPGGSPVEEPLYNMVPPAGEPAEFGANVLLLDSFLDVSVRTGTTAPTSTAQSGDYGLTTTSSNISALLPVFGLSVTLWGVPADPSHDPDRMCPSGVSTCTAGIPLKPLLTLPTTCSQSLTTTAEADAWQSPGDFSTASYTSVDSSNNLVGVSGCGGLTFNPSITVSPDTTSADSPAGLNVDIHVPQSPDTPSTLATPDLESAVVTLPAGTALSPSAADGLQACSESQFGWGNAAQPACPNASKIGSSEIDSPIQADPLVGGIYLAQQNQNPFGSTFAIYVSAESDGVLIKLAGQISANPLTGQLTTTFDNNPQLPFSDFKLDFFGGARAALDTPENCGTFTTTSSIVPWDGAAPATPSASFPISTGCVDPFSPSFTAGSESSQAGAYAPFALSFTRSDSDQDFSGLTVTLPPGVSAQLAGVPLCSDAQIAHARGNSGTAELADPSCPADSQVGTALTYSGPGGDPSVCRARCI